MVKIYEADNKGKATKKYINIYYPSLLKAYVLGWLGMIGIWIGFIIVLIFIFAILGI